MMLWIHGALLAMLFFGGSCSQALLFATQEIDTQMLKELSFLRSYTATGNERVEPISYVSGSRALSEVRGKTPDILPLLRSSFQDMDALGNPIRYSYGIYGSCSAGLLHHARAVSDLLYYFGSLDGESFIECSSGYGGNALLLDRLFRAKGWTWKRYTLISSEDMKPLVSWFLDKHGVRGVDIITIKEWLAQQKKDQVDPRISSAIVFSVSLGRGHIPLSEQEELLRTLIMPSSRALLWLSVDRTGFFSARIIRKTIVNRCIQRSAQWKEIQCLGSDNGAFTLMMWPASKDGGRVESTSSSSRE